jgi:diguanylate cyclase (GGDEF)-like protein
MSRLDRVSAWPGRFSLRTKLAGGSIAVVALTLLVGGASLWSQQRTLETIETYIDVDGQIAELSLRSATAMLKARRHEKDFLLKVRDFGFDEARSRYATLLRAEVAEIRGNMEAIRRLTSDPDIGRQTRQIEAAAGRYEAGFLRVVDLHGRLGRVDTGLEGLFRDKAHEIEALIERSGSDRLMSDLLSLRRREKDFLLRGLDRDVQKFMGEADRFRGEIARVGFPPAPKERLIRLADSYRELFGQYVRTRAAIHDETGAYLAAVMDVEPLLAKLFLRADQQAVATRSTVQRLARATWWTIVGASAIAVLVGLLVAVLISRKIIGSLRECMAFAGRIAQGDLSTRVTPPREREFRTLAMALNGMADALQEARVLQEHRAAELEQANATLHNEVAERKRFEERLEFQTNYDALTGLPNRKLLADRLQQALAHVRREQGRVALLFIDVDNFKLVNDSLGHPLGDRLLKLVAERLAACVRAGDTVARQGGDEFIVILVEPARTEDVAHVAQKIREAIAAPLRIDEHELVISCSIGISIFPEDGDDWPTLLKNADAAMYRAKELGRDTFHFYTGELNDQVMTRLTMEKHLRRALEREEFLLHYQPQVDLQTGRITGAEALLRWQSPELGLVSPGRFIPLAEETGLVVPIGEWVLRTACAQNRTWQQAGLPALTVATNLSARQFRHHDLIATVARALEESGLEPRWLELEIIESMVMQDVEAAVAMAQELKKLGVQLTMDDFGTGYSSLSYLRRFPFDKLKIDISFVREITTDPGSAAIARTIIAMAHNLGLRAIAEGVESEGQLGYLRAQGCDEMQGFFFSKPVPAAEFERLLVEQRRLQLPAESGVEGGRTLLVVDDEAQVTEALGEILRGDGYRVLTAASAREGLELLAVHQVEVVLADHRMPEMNGAEFLGRVKELYPQTVRFALSGYADLETVTEAVNRGAIFKFIAKPWDPGLLRQDVREAFRSLRDHQRKGGKKARGGGAS